MQRTSAARLFALVVGGVLVAAGMLGFFYDSSFGTEDNVLHLLLAVTGLVAGAASPSAPRVASAAA